MENERQAVAVLNTQEAAIYLGLARTTLEKMRHFGRGPNFCRLGGGGKAIRYRRADLDAWIERRIASSTSQEMVA